MFKIKLIISSFIITTVSLFSSFAFAYDSAGYSLAGPVFISITYAGLPFPCRAQFGIYVPTAGSPAAYVVNNPPSYATQFTGSGLCGSITPNGLSATTGWVIGPETEVSTGIYEAPVTGVSVKIGFLSGVTCNQMSTDTVTVTINKNTNTKTFVGTLHAGAIACLFNGRFL